MDEVVVDVENLGKKFCRSLRQSLWYGVRDIARELSGLSRGQALRPNEFWALDSVSFQLKRGEILGLVGHNGAGKTTLLRVLTGLIHPDQGSVDVRGKVGALIALGAGFNPILSGRENISIYAAVLGISRKELRDRFDSIVEFSELGEFIDSPVRTYSSGMRARLGFSVAIHMSPDILLVDEVLAVGDQTFKRKAQKQLEQLLNSGVAVIFVSHNLTQVARLCPKVLWLERGRIRELGDANRVLTNYCAADQLDASQIAIRSSDEMHKRAVSSDRHQVELCSVELLDETDQPIDVAFSGESTKLRIRFQTSETCESRLSFEWWMSTVDGTRIAQVKSDPVDVVPRVVNVIDCRLPNLPLQPGSFGLGLGVADGSGLLYFAPFLTELTVQSRVSRVEDYASNWIVSMDATWDTGVAE